MSKESRCQSGQLPVLTARQEQVYRFIVDFWTRWSFYPTYRAIQKELRYRSVNSIASNVKSLVKKGYLAFTEVNGRQCYYCPRFLVSAGRLGNLEGGPTCSS